MVRALKFRVFGCQLVRSSRSIRIDRSRMGEFERGPQADRPRPDYHDRLHVCAIKATRPHPLLPIDSGFYELESYCNSVKPFIPSAGWMDWMSSRRDREDRFVPRPRASKVKASPKAHDLVGIVKLERVNAPKQARSEKRLQDIIQALETLLDGRAYGDHDPEIAARPAVSLPRSMPASRTRPAFWSPCMHCSTTGSSRRSTRTCASSVTRSYRWTTPFS